MTELEDFSSSGLDTLDLGHIDFSKTDSNIQGAIGERWVAERLGDSVRVQPMLKTWREANLGTRGKQMSAANNPDWLVLNAEGEIVQIVEVKTAASDLSWIEAQKKEYKVEWTKFLETEGLKPDETWESRLSQMWRSNGEKFENQTRLHFKRALELQKAGKIKLAKKPEAVIFVPAGEIFKPWPESISLKTENESIDIPLKIKTMPSIKEFVRVVKARKKTAEISQVAKKQEKPKQEKGATNPAKELGNRFSVIAGDWKVIKESFGISSLQEFDSILKVLIADRMRITPERIVTILGSVAPNLSCHTLFEMSGTKLPPITRAMKNRVRFSGKLADNPDTAERMTRAIAKFETDLKTKGVIKR